jgi:hypothetical protein
MHLRSHLILPAALCALLAACANTGVPDDDIGQLLVAPDKYVLYNCPDIARTAKAIASRQRKLEALMAQANADSGGRMVSAVAYRPEYLEARGEMNVLRQTAREKNCDFLPGAGAEPAATGGGAVSLPPPLETRPQAPAR